jgi:flavodoxin
MKVLIVYLSMGGRTRKVAEDIANNLNSDNVDIEELKYHKRATKMLSVQEEIMKGDLLNFSYDEKIEDLKPYDIIFFGTPTWGSQPVPVFYGYIEKAQNVSGKKFIIFNTCRMVAIKTLEKMEEKIKSKNGIVVKKHTFKGPFRIKKSKVDRFTNEINQEFLN